MEFLKEIEAIAREAGNIIMALYSRDYSVSDKDDFSPLTEADKAANQLIVNRLRELTPLIPILSEEAVLEFSRPNKEGCYWLVDPLDGTKEFISRNGEFTVNIALIENGLPILGVVYLPAYDVLYSAAFGLGAYKEDHAGLRSRITVKSRLAGRPVRVVSSRSHTDQKLQEWLMRYQNPSFIIKGSSIKFCLVAEGLADIYPRFGTTSFWDTAAAHCVLEEAGGVVVNLGGQRLSYNPEGSYLNPHFVAAGDGQHRDFF